MHIIEAVGIDKPKKMSEIARQLGVTMGTLTTGINGLVKKAMLSVTEVIKTDVLSMLHLPRQAIKHITII